MKNFAISMALFGFVACSNNASLPAKTAASTVRKADLAKYAGQNIPDRPKVSAFALDEIEMRLDAFRVGLVSFMQSETPRVEFMIPEPADYVELLRCREDAAAIQDLLNLEMSVGNVTSAVRLMRENDYWQKAATSAACLLLSPSVSENSYFDASAPSGTWRYVGRACVQQARLLDTADLGTRNCSKQVAVSTSLRSFQNLRAEREIAALDDMRNALSRADGMGRRIYFQTVEYNNALVVCMKNVASNMESQMRFSGIAQILGAGISLGSAMLSGSPQNMSVEALWKTGNSALARGAAMGGLLSSFYVNPSQYLQSCPMAEKIQQDLKIISLDLKLAHHDYLAARAVAGEAVASRAAVEK